MISYNLKKKQFEEADANALRKKRKHYRSPIPFLLLYSFAVPTYDVVMKFTRSLE